jgi:alpha-beta hydrolase superfamily lysophospholipase
MKQKETLSQYCAPGARFADEMIPVSDSASLRVITFQPAHKTGSPAIVFVPGWISHIDAWKTVLKEMTRDFTVHYVETREKISSRINRRATFQVKEMGKDIVRIVSHFRLKSKQYILFGSSLGATLILDGCRFLETTPQGLALVGPNAVFRMPGFAKIIIRIFFPPLYFVLKPFIKWYLKTFRLDIKSDYAQYEKYCRALDAADPWKLKKAAISLSRYEVWDLLPAIGIPTLVVGASKDKLHEPEKLKRIVTEMKEARYLDLKTNALAHTEAVVEAVREFCAGLKG